MQCHKNFLGFCKNFLDSDATIPSYQCPARVGFGQSRSEQWRKIYLSILPRSAKWNENTLFEKCKWFFLLEIEKRKWYEKASRSRSEISREFSRIFDNLKKTDFDLLERAHHPPRMVKFFMKLGVKFHSFPEMKVKQKWLEIEIEKWK